MKGRLFFLVVCIVLGGQQSFTQCSDAGVCSIGHQPQGKTHRISVSYLFGKSSKADDLNFHSVVVGADLHVFEDSRVSISVPYSSQSGPLGSTSGFGDATVLWTQRLLNGETSGFSIQFGVKLPLANVNADNLPQAYQSGLGTTDGLFGLSYDLQEWSFAVGYQLSRGRSENRVNRVRRCDDVLLRAGYAHAFDVGRIAGEVLAIKRLAQSNILTSAAGQPEMFGLLAKSNQVQVNIVGRGAYPLSNAIEVQGMLAIPMLMRDVNVDGLTRSFSLSAGLSFAF